MHYLKAKDHWRYQKRDPHTGRWMDATPGELLDPTVPTTGLVQLRRSTDKPQVGMFDERFDVMANGRKLGEVYSGSKRESQSDPGGSAKIWYSRTPGGRSLPASSKNAARDNLLRDVNHEHSRPIKDGTAGLNSPNPTVGESRETYLVGVDHAYEGESQKRFNTPEEAEAYAQSLSSDPYVNSTSIAKEGVDDNGFYTSEPYPPAGVQELDPYNPAVQEMQRFKEQASAYSDLGSSVQDQLATALENWDSLLELQSAREDLVTLEDEGAADNRPELVVERQRIVDDLEHLDINPNAFYMIQDFVNDLYNGDEIAARLDIEHLKEYDDLGWSVQDQMGDVLAGTPLDELNPNALEMISRYFSSGFGTEGGYVADQINEYLKGIRKKSLDIQFYEAALDELDLSLQHAGMNTKSSSAWTIRSLEKAMAEASKIPDRSKLSDDQFALPEERSYPIPDEAHGRLALGRCKGKPEESKVRAAVVEKFPELSEYAAKVLDD